MSPSFISRLADPLTFLMIETALSQSFRLLNFTLATPSLMDWRAQATAIRGKTSHSSILGTMSPSRNPLSSANFASSLPAAMQTSVPLRASAVSPHARDRDKLS
jgi:hypothetical protein